MKRISIIICNRYRTCAGGKCLRALRNRQGAFALYQGEEVEIVGYTTCGGCPGGNVEYAPSEMKKNGSRACRLSVNSFRPSTGWMWLSVLTQSLKTIT
jgi:predicted metal-binding protein